ncbi:CRISPR-associated protein Cas5 [Halobaculum sp. MBLA0147]|uniref:CRISPR-associated protein Cas5 n=1 Tax=Halobaculum sp. MBLA0147 TaxID=3079934 RepID=UPI0035251502
MADDEQVLTAVLDVPFDTAFTKAGAMNGLPTYPVPPVTTIQGLLYAAMGRPSLLRPNNLPKDVRDDEEAFRERVQTECAFGERVLEPGVRTAGLKSRQKRAREDGYITSPARQESLIGPTYQIYVGGPTELLSAFAAALRDPQRLLYLGRSDDLVDVRDVSRTTATHHAETADLECVTPGASGEPTLLPVSPDYRGRYTTHPGEVKTVSVEGGTVDSYYETKEGERFVYLVDPR